MVSTTRLRGAFSSLQVQPPVLVVYMCFAFGDSTSHETKYSLSFFSVPLVFSLLPAGIPYFVSLLFFSPPFYTSCLMGYLLCHGHCGFRGVEKEQRLVYAMVHQQNFLDILS